MFRKCLFAVLAATALLAPPVVAPQSVPKAEAAYKLYYCDVSLTISGRTYRGYLGGYTSFSAAYKYYQMWARGVGPKYSPRLNRIFRA